MANGKIEEAHWKKLGEVSIMTNDKGPFEEDVFWVLIEDDGQNGCIIPLSVPESQKVLERVQQLPGFDNEKLIEAMSSSKNMEFLLWKKENIPSED